MLMKVTVTVADARELTVTARAQASLKLRGLH